MSETRRYESPLREAQAAATRERILDAFVEQLTDPERDTLSPKEAAARAGCSVRTVHSHFADGESRVEALAEHLEGRIFPDGLVLPTTADELPAHYATIHRRALEDPLSRALLSQRSSDWKRVRQRRRAERLEAVRRSVASIGAPPQPTEDTTAMLLVLAGGEISLAMRDDHGLPDDRIISTIVDTVEAALDRLRAVAPAE